MIITVTNMSNDDDNEFNEKQRVIQPGFTPHDPNEFIDWIKTCDVSRDELIKTCVFIFDIDNFSIYSYKRDGFTEIIWVVVSKRTNKPVFMVRVSGSIDNPSCVYINCGINNEVEHLEEFQESLKNLMLRASTTVI